jgi:hypothetical protein
VYAGLAAYEPQGLSAAYGSARYYFDERQMLRRYV